MCSWTGGGGIAESTVEANPDRKLDRKQKDADVASQPSGLAVHVILLEIRQISQWYGWKICCDVAKL